MPHDPKTVGLTHIAKSGFGRHDIALQAKYEAPANDNGGIDTDPFKLRDFEVAGTMSRWLQREYPGHLWACISNLRQGIVQFNIPVLMGMDKWYVVNLRTHDIILGLKKGAGEILERYRIRRGPFNEAEFLDARAKHSRLVLPFRKIPT